MLNAPWLLTNRQFQWTGNGHLQIPLAELGKPSPNIDLLCTTGSNGRAYTIFNIWPLIYNLDLQSQASQGQDRPSCQKSRSKVKWFKHERPQTNDTLARRRDAVCGRHNRCLANCCSVLSLTFDAQSCTTAKIWSLMFHSSIVFLSNCEM